jgi:hypothetical protein
MFQFLTAMFILVNPLPFPDDTPRAGLRAFFSVRRYPNAYEGKWHCQCDCYQPQKDGGYYPALAEAEDDDIKVCMNKVFEIAKTLCPRDAKAH